MTEDLFEMYQAWGFLNLEVKRHTWLTARGNVNPGVGAQMHQHSQQCCED